MSHNLLGIGTDIIYVPRLTRLLQRFPPKSSAFERLTSKFMHPVEKECLNELVHQGQDLTTYLAGIWATKEAMLKALSAYVAPQAMPPAVGIYTKLCFKTNGLRGNPIVEFDPEYSTTSASHAQFYKKYITERRLQALISISHDKDYLVSFLALLGD